VRTYSNGMMLRLAFAIATVRDPEILAIDEVIGVGDANFFEKAFARLLGLRSGPEFLSSPPTRMQCCAASATRLFGSAMAASKPMARSTRSLRPAAMIALPEPRSAAAKAACL